MFGQDNVGINTLDPESHLDIRGTDDDNTGGHIQLATPSKNHFLRLFSGRGLDPKPFLSFASTDTFRIASSEEDFGKFTELITVQADGNVGIGNGNPSQNLDINGKLRIGNDNKPGTPGVMRFNVNTLNFEGHNGIGWSRMNNQSIIYTDSRLNVNLGSTVRNSETAWGDTITIQETGNYLFYVSAYFSSTINEQYASGTPGIKYDNRGRLKIYINGVDYKLLECGNGIIDRDDGQVFVSFAPGTRSFMEVIQFQEGDKINLTKNMQAVPALTPNLSIPDIWIAQMDGFYIQKLD